MSNEGKLVKVHYVGTLDDGTVFDSSRDRGQTLDFTCMAGQMIKGFDVAVRDMEVGQTVDVHIDPQDAYGERREDLVHTFDQEQLGAPKDIEVGAQVVLSGPMGQPMPAKVVAKDEKTITLDLNHELAGQALNFNIELVEVEG